MSTLKTKHIIPIIKFIKKVISKDELKSLVVDVTGKSEEEKRKIQDDKGFDFIFYILDKVPEAEKEFYELVASLTDKSYEDALEVPFEGLYDTISDMVMDPGFKKVFQLAMK